ncbi:MAG: hypothetical protein KAW83_01335, partial [Dehalococcoidia bacterium]|nr:hypothetical protein [Dehalococcoidia bacterium]
TSQTSDRIRDGCHLVLSAVKKRTEIRKALGVTAESPFCFEAGNGVGFEPTIGRSVHRQSKGVKEIEL